MDTLFLTNYNGMYPLPSDVFVSWRIPRVPSIKRGENEEPVPRQSPISTEDLTRNKHRI